MLAELRGSVSGYDPFRQSRPPGEQPYWVAMRDPLYERMHVALLKAAETRQRVARLLPAGPPDTPRTDGQTS